MDEVRVRIRPWLLLCIVFTASLLQVSVGQRPNMRVSFDTGDKNLVTLFCLRRYWGGSGQPATFTFTNPLNAQDTEEQCTSTVSLTFSILPESETLVSCRLNGGSVDSETVAITALPRYTGTATSILQYVFSDSDTVELTCPLDTGRLHGLITPYEFIWNVKVKGDLIGQDEVTNANGTAGTFHYRDNNRLLSVNLSSLLPNVQYSFQCLGRLERCNSTFGDNVFFKVCREDDTEATNSPFFPVNIVDPVVITNPPSNVNVTQGQDASFNCTVTNGEGDITIKWEINRMVYDSENCGNICTVEETDNDNSTLTVYTGTLDRVMNETTLNIVCTVSQTVPERPQGMNETIEVRSIYRNLSSEAAQLVLSPAPTTTQPPTAQPPTAQPTTPTSEPLSSSSVIPISTFSIVVVLLIASFTLSHCIVCIFCYYFRTNLKGTQKRQICCCLQNRVKVPDVYYEPVPSLLHQPHITRATESQVATASTNETNSEQMTINSPVYQVDNIHQSDPRSGIDYSHTAISAYRTADTSTDPEIVSEHNEDYERNEMTASREVGTDMGFLTTLVNEIEDSDIMQRESQPSLHFTLTANSAYGTDVAIAPEILTEQNEAYERNEVTTSRDTNSTEFTTSNSMSEIEHSDIMRQEYQPSTYFTVKVSNLSSGLQTLV